MSPTRPTSTRVNDTEGVAAPPRIAQPSTGTPRVILILTGVVVAGLVLLFVFDPARHAVYPMCMFKKTTGYDCPGCGGLRAMHHLLRGDIIGAFQLNAMAMVALPLTLVWLALRWRCRDQRRPLTGRKVLWTAWAIALALVLFGIVRNLPFWPFGITPG